MAIVDVSRIPNNNKFDPVREAILELEGLLTGGFAGVTSINGQTENVNIVAGENITVTAANGVITISSTASGGGGIEGALTLTAGSGISLSDPSVFDGSTDLEVTISHSDTSSVTNKTNTGGNVIQSMTFDEFGHVQTAGYTDLDTRYLAFRSIQTNNDNQLTTATSYDDVVEFEGSGSISVTKSPVSNEIRFGLSLSDIRFEDGVRVARGFLYYQGGASAIVWNTENTIWSTNNNFWGLQEPTIGDVPTGSTFDFTSNTITINDTDWAETPPTTGYAFTTYYVVRYEARDEGGAGETARPVTYGDVTDAVGFEGPVTFNSLAEELGANGLTIIDGGRIRTGIISSVGLSRVGIDAGTSVFTENGSYFELATGDIATTEFSVLDGNGYFKGNLYIGDTLLDENNTLNSNTTAADVSGLGALATEDTVAASQITGLGDLALEDFVNANTQITGLGALALLDAVTTDQVSGLGALSLLDTVNTNQVVGLGALATLDSVSTSQVVGLGSLALLDRVSTGLIDGLGLLATEDGVDVSQVSGLGALAELSTITAAQIENAAVTVDAIANNAITEGKIAANAVTSGKLVANAVISDKIAANAIVSDKIATDAIISSKILAGAITTAKISAGAVTAAKINAGDLAANTAFMNTLLATDGTFTGTLQAGLVTINTNTITIGASTNYTSKGIIQFNDDDGQSAASISTNLTQLGPLTVSELLIDADTFLRLQAPNIVIDASNSLSFGSEYDKVSDYTGGTATVEQNHSIKLAGGAIIKWGYHTGTTVTNFVPFPVAFPTNCSSVSVTTNRSSQSSNGANYAYSVARTGFVAVIDDAYDFWWIAIGF